MMARTTRITVKYSLKDLEDAQRKVRDVLEEGSEVLAQAASRLAPYDLESRHAKGETPYPDVHHKHSIYAGKAKSTEKGGVTFGVTHDWGGSWYVRSASGRGYWLEKGTKSNDRKYTRERETHKRRMEVINKYGLAPDKATKKLMSKWEKRLLTNAIKSIRQTGEVVKFKTAKYHAATPARPHFEPALSIAKRYIELKLKNLL